MLGDASSELDFKMIDNAVRTVANAGSLLMPYADNWQ